MSIVLKNPQKRIMAVLAIVLLAALLFGALMSIRAQTNCYSYNDSGTCISWGQTPGFSSYEEWLAWNTYWDCVADNRTVNNNDGSQDDVECELPSDD